MKYIAAIDQSTSGSKAFLVDENGFVVKRASLAHQQFYPKPGYAEHDAEEIYQNVLLLLNTVLEGIPAESVQAIALANQRETTVFWDKETGEPLCRAIVWQDVRGETACRQLDKYAGYIHETTGILLSPYYPAGKIRALFAERPDIRKKAEEGSVRIGTIDNYLVARLTGKSATDTSNASRTQLMNLKTLKWDDKLLEIFGIPKGCMAEEILPADADFGTWNGIPVTGVLGDSHATLFGLGCLKSGMAKTSYGTGSSVMMNVGNAPIISGSGLSASVGFSMAGETMYVLEGNITCSGDTLIWLCKGLNIFESPQEIQKLAESVDGSMGVNLVPAMSGLGAPYFDSDACAILCGMSRGTEKAHIAYAALASIAQQITDVLDVMNLESGYSISALSADGGGSKNELLMQLQADLAKCSLRCASADDVTGLGAAYIAGIRTGMYASFESIPANQAESKIYHPKNDRANLRAEWKTAVQRARIK